MVACVSAEAKAKVAVTTIDDAPTKDMEPVLLDFQRVQDGTSKSVSGIKTMKYGDLPSGKLT